MIERLRNLLATSFPGFIGDEDCQSYAVLIPLIRIQEEWHILFESRSKQLRRQPGEISFPGGKMEAQDANSEAAAVRETCEELGLRPEDLTLLGQIKPMITPFNLVIYPHVAVVDETAKMKLTEGEVAEIFSVPISTLLAVEPQCHFVELAVQAPDTFPFELIRMGKDYPWRRGRHPEWFYLLPDRVIWGITAAILREALVQICVAGNK